MANNLFDLWFFMHIYPYDYTFFLFYISILQFII